MELHRTRSLLHDAPDIDRRIILKDCRFTGSSPDNSGTCVQIDYTLEAPSPHGNCYYCASPDHEDTPCPRRRADATRYAAEARTGVGTVIREALENHKPVAKHLKGS